MARGMMKEIIAPAADLVRRARTLKPVVQDAAGRLFFIMPVDVFSPFNRAPVLTEPALDLKRIEVVETEHSFSDSRVFLADVSEVLSQLPGDLLDLRPVAFKTVPKQDGARFLFNEAGDRHLARTVIYAGTLPESVLRQPVMYNGQRLLPGQKIRSIG